MTLTTSVFLYLVSRISVASIWVNLHQRSQLWLGCEKCVPWRQICLNSNLQVNEVGWTNQTIPCFLLSSLIWIQSWIASLYSGWCCIWRYHCQRLIPTKGLMRLFYQTRAILKSCIVMTLCGLRWPARVLTSLASPSNFVITPYGKAGLLIIETLKSESKKSLTLHSTNYWVPFDFV